MANIQFGSYLPKRVVHQHAEQPPELIDAQPWNPTIPYTRFGLFECRIQNPRAYWMIKPVGKIDTDIPITLTRVHKDLYKLKFGENQELGEKNKEGSNKFRVFHVRAVRNSSKIHLHGSLHRNVLRVILDPLVDQGYYCFHDDFSKSLHDLLETKTKEFFWTRIHHENHRYTMSAKFLSIIRGIVCGTTFLREKHQPVNTIDPNFIVFDKLDTDFSTPLLIDCHVISKDGGLPANNLDAVACLIIEIAIKHGLMMNYNVDTVEEHLLGPQALLFLRYLQVGREDYMGEIFHPIFLNSDEKAEYLIRVNNKMHDPKFQGFNFSTQDLCNWMTGLVDEVVDEDVDVDPFGGWYSFMKYSRVLKNEVYNRKKDGTAWDFDSVRDLITLLRNTYVHGNDKKKKKKDMQDTPDVMVLTKKKNYGRLIEKDCPALLPLLFHDQGNLLQRKKL